MGLTLVSNGANISDFATATSRHGVSGYIHNGSKSLISAPFDLSLNPQSRGLRPFVIASPVAVLHLL